MILLKRIKEFVSGLLRLAAVCLVVEQLGYLVLVPGYYWALLASPVFWGLFSAVCFYQLWRFNRKYPDHYASETMCNGWNLEGETNPTTGLPMAGGIDVSGALYGGRPESGFIKFDSF
ncbi:hypothetical protein [Endozoicomonas arenosclerae]|uniref:hypothetical protein n=1 Tax=Endozoicomonas arenosclerae TaxID=1633495 RepID=UPI000781BC88|nr:hypothetical protein [Endozoicomonas arenosclerae]